MPKVFDIYFTYLIDTKLFYHKLTRTSKSDCLELNTYFVEKRRKKDSPQGN